MTYIMAFLLLKVRCNRLLTEPSMKGKIAGQIKCLRCGTVNEI